MNLPPLDIPTLLRRHGLRPDRRLGQNFLVDQVALRGVVETAELSASDTVLEIGAGLGSLTRLLAQAARRVIAVELDAGLIPLLKEIVSQFPNVQVIQGDILKLNLPELVTKPGSPSSAQYRVVANIPYNITSALIRHLLEARLPPQRLVLTVQREVAERICAEPGEMSLLALSVQVYGLPRIVKRIPARAFYPVPKVDSAVVRSDVYPSPLVEPTSVGLFFRLAKAGFSQKRKTLRNALAGGMRWKTAQAETILREASIDPQRRAETLSIEEWKRLTESAEQRQQDSSQQSQSPG